MHESTRGVDGWVSLELSPLLANDTAGSISRGGRAAARAQRPNVFIKIPGTPEGVPAIEESIFRGVPINVTLLFSPRSTSRSPKPTCVASSGGSRRDSIREWSSVASIFVSRWDVAVQGEVPPALRNRLGIAVAQRTYREYRRVLASPRWRALAAAGARPQRLLWASTGTKDPKAPDTMYVEALAAPDTIDTMPDKTLLAFADHGNVTEPDVRRRW